MCIFFSFFLIVRDAPVLYRPSQHHMPRYGQQQRGHVMHGPPGNMFAVEAPPPSYIDDYSDQRGAGASYNYNDGSLPQKY